jgi:hypothetical protein
MPRAALLSIHARVAGTGPAAWEDPSLVQLWGPRFAIFVIAARDLAVFSLALLPDAVRGRSRAEDLAARLAAAIGGARVPHQQAGDAVGVKDANTLKYAAATGTMLIRWEGARQAVIWTVPRPETDPRDARLELTRRYLHVYGPATPEAFGWWSAIGPQPAAAAFEALGGELVPVQAPAGQAWMLSSDEAGLRAAMPTTCCTGPIAISSCPTPLAATCCGPRASGRAPCWWAGRSPGPGGAPARSWTPSPGGG